ncbi:MAG: hypothetical protein H7Y38_10370, partial [Armatimonadetes bacterium]|nr:hypothetical protein [Armatimonadota bacterium]
MESYNQTSGITAPNAFVVPAPITVRDILAILRRRAGLALTVFAATVGATLFVTSQMPPVYESGCQVTLDNAPPPAMPSNVLDLINNGGNSSGDLIMAKIKSRAFLSEVIRKVNHPAMTNPDALRGALSVALTGGDQILNIQTTVKHDAKLARDLSNMVAAVYIEYVRAENDKKMNASAGRLERVKDKAEREMKAANAKVQAFTRKRGLSNLNPLYETQSNLTITVRNSLDAARRELPLKESNVAYYQKQVNTVNPVIYAGTSANRNPQIDEFRANIVRLETDRELLGADFGENSPEIKDIDRKIVAFRVALKRLQGNEFLPGSQSIPRNPDYGAAVTGLYAAKNELRQIKESIVKLTGQLKSLQDEQEILA